MRPAQALQKPHCSPCAYFIQGRPAKLTALPMQANAKKATLQEILRTQRLQIPSSIAKLVHGA